MTERNLTLAHQETIVELVCRFREIIAPAVTGVRELTSFSSKYLHCHAPSVVIYDSRARRQAKQLLVAAGLEPVRETKDRLNKLPAWAQHGYGKYVYRFGLLLRHLNDVTANLRARPHISVQEFDFCFYKMDQRRERDEE